MNRIRALTRSIHWLVAAFALALVCRPGAPLRADDKSDLISKIEDKLGDAADALARLPDDSNDSAIDRARGYVDEARRYAEDLGRVAGDDSSAKRIAEGFRDIQDDWNDASNYLRQLKAGMRQAEPIATTCGERDKELVRRAREYESRNDPDGLVELPKEAAAIQDAVKRQLDELRRNDDRMDDLADSADDFRGDGPWRELVGAVAQTARRSFEVWRKSFEQTQRACENLTKGVDHPEVKDVLARLGNSAGGRKAVIEQLNKDARELWTTLAGVSEDSGMGSVERAKGLLQSIERGVEALGRTATTDKETRLILEKWPEGIRQLKDALDDLEDLKLHQHDMDPLPDRCVAKERELQDAIGKNGSDTDGIEDLPKLADAIAQPVIAGLDKAKERMKEEGDDLQRAKAISVSEGPWSEIRAAEQRDADETFKTFEDNFKKTEQACANVIKGKDAPAVKEAIERLARGAQSSGSQLETDVDVWVARAKAVYVLDCQGMKDIWAGYCAQDWGPGDESEQKAAARTIADPIKDRMRSAIDGVIADLPALEARVKLLADKRETQRAGKALETKLSKERKRLDRLKANPALAGNYDIMLQFSNNYGKQQHERMWGRFGCTVPVSSTAEAKFPSEGRKHNKPDCVDPSGCKIWEFKAKGPDGERDGPRQAADYQHLVPLYYNKLVKPDGSYAPADSSLGGQAIMDTLMQRCYRNKEIELEARVEYYDPCKEQYECTTD
ncbi:MAG: hypothetical protein IPL61_34020 [Myxococcales bacterium]|nr:hypothetical protein [Myxococcales bacterium]